MKNPKDTCSFYIDMLCNRFRNRGIAEKVQSDAEQGRRSSEKSRKKYPPDVRDGRISDKYRTGSYNGRAYMSSDDFIRYYKDTRSLSAKVKSRDEEEYKKALAASQTEAQPASKKESRLTVKKLLGQKLREFGIFPFSLKRMVEKVNEGFPGDESEDEDRSKRKRVPRGLALSMLVVFTSLLLIVTSSVMVSRVRSDVARLEYRLEVLKNTEAKLYADLEVKNNMIEIKAKADEYGMVSAEYVASRYIYIEREDKIEIGSGKPKSSALINMLDALGLAPED